MLTLVTLMALFAAPAQGSAAAPPLTPVAPASAKSAKADDRLQVLVLDVKSEELSDAERATLTNLITGHLGEQPRLAVLSNEDVKQLVALQGQAQEIGVNSNCTNDACLAEIAGALGAGLVVATQAGKLGETIVITLAIFDASKAKSVARKSVTADSLGDIAHKLGPALDELVRPLLNIAPAPGNPPQTTSAAAPAAPAAALPRVVPAKPMSAAGVRVGQLYGSQAIQICVDARDASQWWFCNRTQVFTENAFVRQYRERTGAHDLDGHEVDRSSNRWVNVAGYGVLGLGGVAAAGVALACGTDNCGSPLNTVLPPLSGTAESPLNTVLALTLGTLTAVAGVVLGADALGADGDGTPRQHTLNEGEARAAIAAFNAALHTSLAHELGA